MSRATKRALDCLTRLLGRPVATPEFIMDSNCTLEPASYRVFRWRCCWCGGGENDPKHIYRPLALDSDGKIWCEEEFCDEHRLRT
jgi:hypothetical protein